MVGIFPGRIVASALAVTALLVGSLPALSPQIGEAAAMASEARTRNWTTSEVLEGMLFVQGHFGKALIDSGALGPLSTDQASAVREALAEPAAAEIASSVAAELQAQFPATTSDLMRAISGSDPVAVQAAMGSLGRQFRETPTMKRVTAGLPGDVGGTYVPGEIGTDCGVLVWVVAGAVLVVTIAAVGLGVVALASTVAVGSTKVAGQNAIRKSTGANAQEQEDELTAQAIRIFHGE